MLANVLDTIDRGQGREETADTVGREINQF